MITTEGKTLQQVSDEIARKLIEQEHQCQIDDNGLTRCVYGDGTGSHCAIGWLLPEDNKELMQFAGGVDALIAAGSGLYGTLGPNNDFICDNQILLQMLQLLHDAERPNRTGLTTVITEVYGLDTTAWEPWTETEEEQ